MESHDLTERENSIILDLLASNNYQEYLNENNQVSEQGNTNESNNFQIPVQYDSNDTENLQRVIELQQQQIKFNEFLLQQQYAIQHQHQDIQKHFNPSIANSHEQNNKKNEVVIFKDSHFTIPFDEQHLIKEKVYYFLLSGVFSSFDESDVQSNQILQIHSDVFQYDKRRSSFSKEIIGDINAKVVDENGETQTTCENCSKQTSVNSCRSIIQVKYASRCDNDAHVIASLFCSGNPSNSKRRLKVTFTTTSSRFPNWEGSTKLFSVYHHKPPQRKVESQSKNTDQRSHPYSDQSITKKNSNQDQHILKQHKILKRTFKIPTGDSSFSSIFAELYTHLVELCDADSTNFYNSTFIHSAIVMSYDMATNCKWDKEDINISAKLIIETVISGIGVVAFCCQDRNEQTIEKICSFIVKNSQIGDIKDPLWAKIYSDMHALHQTGKGLKICDCEECYYSHLAYVIQYAHFKKGASTKIISDQLNELKIPTKQNKKWHSSLNGFLTRKGSYQPYMLDFDSHNELHLFSMIYCKDMAKQYAGHFHEALQIVSERQGEDGKFVKDTSKSEVTDQFYEDFSKKFESVDINENWIE